MNRIVVLSVALLSTAAWAIDPPRPQSPPAAEPKSETPAKPAEPAVPPEEDETLPPLPADAPPAGPPPARFNPTEKVRADFPVSFPVDI